jgi:hypothetical protein
VACGAIEPTSTFDSRTADGAPGNVSTEVDPIDAGPAPEPMPCKPRTCEQLGAECGAAGDGCGGILADCGKCPVGFRCGGPGAPAKCVDVYGITCVAKTCQDRAVECGPADDDCNGIITSCGSCDAGERCGSDTARSKCVADLDASCTPTTCEDAGATCGQIADGCGALTPSCGTCTGNTICKHGVCVPACAPRTCAGQKAQCGYIADGCSGVVDCGLCPDGFECGAGGHANVCGRP